MRLNINVTPDAGGQLTVAVGAGGVQLSVEQGGPAALPQEVKQEAEAPALPAPVKKKGGRPRGSRNRKPADAPAVTVRPQVVPRPARLGHHAGQDAEQNGEVVEEAAE